MARRPYIDDVAQRLYEQAAFFEGLTQHAPNYKRYKKVIKSYEGKNISEARHIQIQVTKKDGTTELVNDSPYKSVGYSHLMEPVRSKKAFSLALPGVPWEAVRDGDYHLSDEQADRLLEYDTIQKVDEAYELWPTFKDPRLSQDIRDQGIALWYQGSFTKSRSKGSSSTMRKIDQALAGEESWGAAALEMLNRTDYIKRGKRDENGYNGVATRHEQLALSLWALDPPGARDYDLPTAIQLDLGQRQSDTGFVGRVDGTFHFPSRVGEGPQEGLLLKDIEHREFATGLDEDVGKMALSVYWSPENNRMYTMSPLDAPAEFTQLAWNVEQDTLSDPKLTDASLVGRDIRPEMEKPRY